MQQQFEQHLYMIVYPINALVASQLTPKFFASHYTVGSTKHYKGKVIFAEIDINFRDPYFDVERFLSLTVPHEDGSPKKTKFISSYNVLEHVDLKALKNLYLVSANGKSLEIESKPYTVQNEPGLIRVYQEITPLSNLVASNLDQRNFGRYITKETKSKGCPKIFFTQLDLQIEKFLTNRNLIHEVQIPETNPTRLFECLMELKTTPAKKTKTISLNSALKDASYLLIRHGYWFSEGEELVFYPMPTREELERTHYEWWKHAQ